MVLVQTNPFLKVCADWKQELEDFGKETIRLVLINFCTIPYEVTHLLYIVLEDEGTIEQNVEI